MVRVFGAIFLFLAASLSIASPEALAGRKPASESTGAEAHRLEQELERLVRRDSWKGAERTYLAMTQLGVPLTPQAHIFGAQSMFSAGDVTQGRARLLRALPDTSEASYISALKRATAEVPGSRTPPMSQESARQLLDDAVGTLNELEQSYGVVDISVDERRIPALVKFEMPFGPRELAAVGFAREALQRQRQFAGLLPVGGYMIDGVRFDVAPGNSRQDVRIGS